MQLCLRVTQILNAPCDLCWVSFTRMGRDRQGQHTGPRTLCLNKPSLGRDGRVLGTPDRLLLMGSLSPCISHQVRVVR